MKLVLKDNRTYILRIDKGEDVIEEVTKFCNAETIQAGFFRAIGAASEITISWYNVHKKEYTDRHIQEDLEIISVTGNVAMLKGKSYVHAHGCLSNEAMEPVAGHIKQLRVAATCEVVLEALQGTVEREYSEEIGLNLFS
ncbi:DNA-binding protein [Patescibacteria group bacterium]|nr:DNA-binding protein [Patescibacteria group bacterium]